MTLFAKSQNLISIDIKNSSFDKSFFIPVVFDPHPHSCLRGGRLCVRTSFHGGMILRLFILSIYLWKRPPDISTPAKPVPAEAGSGNPAYGVTRPSLPVCTGTSFARVAVSKSCPRAACPRVNGGRGSNQTGIKSMEIVEMKRINRYIEAIRVECFV